MPFQRVRDLAQLHWQTKQTHRFRLPVLFPAIFSSPLIADWSSIDETLQSIFDWFRFPEYLDKVVVKRFVPIVHSAFLLNQTKAI